MTADYKQSDLGIDSPDGSSTPLHDHSTQSHAFAYLEDILETMHPYVDDLKFGAARSP